MTTNYPALLDATTALGFSPVANVRTGKVTATLASGVNGTLQVDFDPVAEGYPSSGFIAVQPDDGSQRQLALAYSARASTGGSPGSFTISSRGLDSTTDRNIAIGERVGMPPFAAHHNDHSDATIAIQGKLGTGASTPAANTVLQGTGTGTSAWATKLALNGTGPAFESLPTALWNVIGFQGETAYDRMGISDGTSGMAASSPNPLIHIARHMRPNAASGVTVANYLFKASRHGSTTASDGNAEAVYNLVGLIETDSASNNFNGGHDVVGTAGLAKTISGSPGRSFGLYGHAWNYSSVGQAIGLEIDVCNGSGATAPAITSGFTSKTTTGLIISGQTDGAGSTNNSAAIYVGTNGQFNSGDSPAFRTGLYFAASSITDYAIDLINTGAAGGGVIRLPNNGWIVGRNTANSADIGLFKLTSANEVYFGDALANAAILKLKPANTTSLPASDTGAGCLALTWNKSAGNAEVVLVNTFENPTTAFEFWQKTGTSTGSKVLGIAGTGILDFASGAKIAVGTTTTITLGKTGGSGPATAAQNSWLKITVGGTAYFIPLWA